MVYPLSRTLRMPALAILVATFLKSGAVAGQFDKPYHVDTLARGVLAIVWDDIMQYPVEGNHLVVVNDLLRSRGGLLLAHLASRLFTGSDVVRVDGPRSVRAAYSLGEIRALAGRAGLESARIEPRWPCRFVLTWKP